jgi:exodeoxyribonuclease V alpha subunit
VAEPDDEVALVPVREAAVRSARSVIDAARAGNAAIALRPWERFRVLCAHGRGDHGVASWMARTERWITEQIDAFAAEGQWYPGAPCS